MAIVNFQERGSEVSETESRCPKCGYTTGVYAGKSRGLAIVLAWFLGEPGIHKFYLGKLGAGFLYLTFCLTFIPAVLGLIDAIVLATRGSHQFSGGVKASVVHGLKPNDSGEPAVFSSTFLGG